MEEVREFIQDLRSTSRERERKRDEEHKQNSDKLNEISAKATLAASKVAQKSLIWNIVGVLVAIAALAITALSVYVAVKVSHGELILTHPFTTEVPAVLAAER